jgi:protein tyrosine phosphatase (PTP) superfamily phosphohydrolase (DUF442 family)
MNLTNPVRTILRFFKLGISQYTPIDMMGDKLEDIFNYLKLDEAIATAGQPTERQLSSIKTAGYRSIINLAPGTHENALPNEREIVESLGIEYIHIPVIFDRPIIENFDRFCEVVNSRLDRPIFVHCAANLRVSSFIYLYRRIDRGMTHADAAIDLAKLWTPNPIWQEFIDRTIAEKLTIDS